MRPFYIEFNEKQQQFHENEEYVDSSIDDFGWKRITERKQTDSLEFTYFIYFVRAVLFGKERKISQKAIESYYKLFKRNLIYMEFRKHKNLDKFYSDIEK
jgi:hypothetical protein